MSLDKEKLVNYVKQYPVAVVCAVLSVAMLAAIYFRTDAVAKSNAKYDLALSEMDAIDANSTNSKNLKSDLEQINELAEDIQSRLMRGVDSQNIHFLYFARLAEASGVLLDERKLNGFYASWEKASPLVTKDISQIEYGLTVSGDFHKVLDFIYRLYTGRNFIRLDSLTITPDPILDGSTVTAQMVLRGLAETPPKPKKEKK